jgi:hypothetical protein
MEMQFLKYLMLVTYNTIEEYCNSNFQKVKNTAVSIFKKLKILQFKIDI